MRCGRPGSVFGPVVEYFLACGGGAECHTGLLLWLCTHPVSTVWLAAAGVCSGEGVIA